MKLTSLRSIFLSLCLLTFLLPAPVNAEPAAADLNRFLAAYTKPVFDMLTRIRTHKMTRQGRFLILSSTKPTPQHYVQCFFENNDTKIMCEAASGYYDKPGYHISAKRRNAIKNMGFEGDDNQGNFRREFMVTGPETLRTVARIMLETLYRGYGVGVGEMKLCAPFNPKTDHCYGGGMLDFPWPVITENLAPKVDNELGFKLLALAKGAKHGNLYGGPDDMSPFLIYEEAGKYVGLPVWYAINPWTGDIWNVFPGKDCKHLVNPALVQEQQEIKKRFSTEELKEYKRLSELKPYRMSDFKPCGSPEEK